MSLFFLTSLLYPSFTRVDLSCFCEMMSFEQIVRCGLEDISIQRQQAQRAESRDASWRVANGVADLPIQIESQIDAIMAPTRLTLWLTDEIWSGVEKEYSHDKKMGRAPSLGPGAGTAIAYYGIVESCEKQLENEIMEVLDASAPVLLDMEKKWQKERGRYDEDGYFVTEETDAYIEWQKFLFEQCNPSEADAQDVERNGFAGSRLEFRDSKRWDPYWVCGGEVVDWRISRLCELVEMSEDMDLFDLEVDMLHYLIGSCSEDGPASDGMDWFDYDHKMEHCGHGIQPILQHVPLKLVHLGAKYSTVEWKYGKAYCSNYVLTGRQFFHPPGRIGPFLGMEFVGDLRFNPGNVSNWAVAVDTDGQHYGSVSYKGAIIPHP